MKIVFLHYTIGLIERGSEISTKALADWMAKQNNQVWICQSGVKENFDSYKIKRIKLPFSPLNKKKINFLGKILARFYLNSNNLLILFFSLRTVPFLIRKKPDIIIPTNGFWQVVICKIVKLFTGSKIVIIGRAGIGWHDKDNLRLNPDLFIALSQQAKKWAQNINNKIKTVYLPNPINIEKFLKTKNKQIDIKLPSPIILTVAALTKYKRIDQLIKACAYLKKSSLLIVGQGELKEELVKMGEKHLKNRYQIRTFKNKQMSSVYQSVDLFVLLSEHREAFGRVFLEAMACGLSIVTRDFQSRREIIGRKGVYLKSIEPETIARGIKKGLQLGKDDFFKQQVKKFSIEKIGPKYEKVFKDIIK